MFNQLSRAGVGMYSSLLFSLLQLINLNITETQVEEFVIAVGTIVSIGLWVWGQLDREDLKKGLIRK